VPLRCVLFLLAATLPASGGSVGTAADRVQEALHAGRDLRPLVARGPDPWLVADELCRRGDFDAASAFATAEAGPLTAGLDAYVAARRQRPSRREAYAAFAEAGRALQAGSPKAALARVDAAEVERDVIGLRLRHRRADALRAMGRLEDAEAALVTVATEAQKLGWLRRTADARFRAGQCVRLAGDTAGALAHWQAARELLAALGHKRNEAHVLNTIGVARFDRAEYLSARRVHETAVGLSRSAGDPRGTATGLTHLANCEWVMGDYAAALSHHEESLALRVRLGNPVDVAQVLQNLGLVHRRLGDLDRAASQLSKAARLCEEARLARPLLLALLALAGIEADRNEVGASDTLLKRAGALADKLKDPVLAARVHGSLGQNRRREGARDAAARHYEKALLLAAGAGNTDVAGLAREALGEIAREQGHFAEARALIGKALDAARAAGNLPVVARCLVTLARVHLDEENPAAALTLAGEALAHGHSFARGLSFEEGVVGRAASRWNTVGIEAALAMKDAAALYRFIEAGRAGALIEALGGREAVRSVEVPAPLALERAERAKTLAAATTAAEKAHGASRKELRRTRTAVAAARKSLRRLDARIERRRREVAAATAPEPLPAARVQAQLGADQALVLYELGPQASVALVVTPRHLRHVRLGTREVLAAACESLRADDTGADPSDALARLRALLVDPLDLPGEVRTVLVSPDGPLTFVPFALLLEGRTLSYVPSGSVFARLSGEGERRGTGVLAVGDPAHPRLLSLPHARQEAKSLGTRVLLGADATEPAFRRELARHSRWRSIHFACHGIVDKRHPTLSGLALAPSPGEDGVLRVFEISRMDIAADIAVLSGCETGRGRVYGTEGLVGLAGAFTLAGPPRVLASLWRVDDAATAELMRVFYRSWRAKGGDAAEALRTAQEAVRKHQRWRHPAYWAAWVIWGPP